MVFTSAPGPLFPSLKISRFMRFTNCSSEFLRGISRRRRSAKYGVESISEYVEQCSALLTPEQLDELRAKLPLLNVRFAAATFYCLCGVVDGRSSYVLDFAAAGRGKNFSSG